MFHWIKDLLERLGNDSPEKQRRKAFSDLDQLMDEEILVLFSAADACRKLSGVDSGLRTQTQWHGIVSPILADLRKKVDFQGTAVDISLKCDALARLRERLRQGGNNPQVVIRYVEEHLKLTDDPELKQKLEDILIELTQYQIEYYQKNRPTSKTN